MLLGAALVLVGGAILYYAVTGDDPRTLLIREAPSLAGAMPAPLAQPGTTPQGAPPSQGTSAIKGIVLAARVVPGWTQGRICGADTLAGEATSEHFYCNAADLDVPGDDFTGTAAGRVVGDALSAFLVNGGRSGLLPVHCVIWNGSIWSREAGWQRRPYGGSNPHKGHVHVSAWPSKGGAC